MLPPRASFSVSGSKMIHTVGFCCFLSKRRCLANCSFHSVLWREGYLFLRQYMYILIFMSVVARYIRVCLLYRKSNWTCSFTYMYIMCFLHILIWLCLSFGEGSPVISVCEVEAWVSSQAQGIWCWDKDSILYHHCQISYASFTVSVLLRV